MIHNSLWDAAPWAKYWNLDEEDVELFGRYFSAQLGLPISLIKKFTARQLDKRFNELRIYEIFNDSCVSGDS